MRKRSHELALLAREHIADRDSDEPQALVARPGVAAWGSVGDG
jgi:hypothetical protein